jgi:hypothetical protein
LGSNSDRTGLQNSFGLCGNELRGINRSSIWDLAGNNQPFFQGREGLNFLFPRYENVTQRALSAY